PLTAIMQSPLAGDPEFNPSGPDAEPAPVRRTGNVRLRLVVEEHRRGYTEALRERRHALDEVAPSFQHVVLGARPGPETRKDRSRREVGVALLGCAAGDEAFHARLATGEGPVEGA